ncbi:hypothetical protein AB0X56_04285 [Weissella paramesenteroides]|uniref:hypothetical protein n=1 Tax=Weissella paramesenteroides TaxID=1249 RepID=UPI003F2218F7
MNIQQMQMPAIVNENGELIPINQAINKKNIKDIPDEQLEDIAYTVKMFDPQINIVKAEMKQRVKEGHSFNRYILSDRENNKLDTDNNVFKQEMQLKYGWNALEVKSATQLKRQFGDQVTQDIERHTVHGVRQVAEWQ